MALPSPASTETTADSTSVGASLRAPGAVLLVACYELGHQPLSLASPLATLRQAGYGPVAIDTTVSELDDATIRAARFVAIASPMHTALRIGTQVAARVRSLTPQTPICFYGLYATLNADFLLKKYADACIGGEYEGALLALVEALDAEAEAASSSISGRRATLPTIAGVRTREHTAEPIRARLPFAIPARETLEAPARYARLVRADGRIVPAGYVEASRGCLHTCLHCPITPVYGGRFFVVPREVVLADIRAQVAQGVEHITFGDPDFLNGPKHSLAIVRALHEEFPALTFDATIKIEHIIERRMIFPELATLGCAFVVSAVESLSPNVLRHLAKGHTRADVEEALRILDAAGIPMRPTFVAFTPWTTADDYLELLDFVGAHGLIDHIDPVQYSIRLLVPPGSALLDAGDVSDWLGPLDETALSYQWAHPDPRMDRLQHEVAALVEDAARRSPPAEASETFAAIHSLAQARLRRQKRSGVAKAHGSTALTHEEQPVVHGAVIAQARRVIPHLTEAWFC